MKTIYTVGAVCAYALFVAACFVDNANLALAWLSSALAQHALIGTITRLKQQEHE